MKLTNKYGLPDLIFRYLNNDSYDYESKGSSYSCTELLKPIQQIVLERRHFKEIEVDAIDSVWRVFGSGVHATLEGVKGSDLKPIERMRGEVLGTKISGKFDVLKGTQLTDYKVTSVWKIVYKSGEEDWKMQLSIYRWLWNYEKNQVLDNIGTIIAILRDWSARDLAKSKGSYPKAPIIEIPIELYSIQDTEKFLTDKILALQANDNLKDDELPPCTSEERWWNEKQGKFMRCEKYCSSYKFCHQIKREEVA